ncbi:MAG: hypothetical protein ABI844_07250 [Saprospiraceae bacterium]
MTEFATKEKIKERLWQYATERWHIDNKSKTFDPIVDLLFGGISHEVEKIYHTIRESHNQVFDHLTEVLLPDQYLKAKPAHGILMARPVTDSKITKSTIFFDADDKDQFSYSPAGTYNLISADVLYMATGKDVFAISDKCKKDSKFSFQIGKELAANSFYIAIKPADESSISAAIYNLYFHVTDPGKVPYDVLPLAQIVHEEQSLINNKFIQLEEEEDLFISQLKHLGMEDKLDQNTFNYYQPRYIQIDLKGINTSYNIPVSLASFLTLQSVEQLKSEKCIWLKIELPEIWSNYIKSTTCLLNCIPVINRKLVEYKESHPENIVIKPLADQNQNFLSLHSLSADNKSYSIMDDEHPTNTDNSPGSFQIVKGGVFSLDERGASTMVNHLLDMVEESGKLDLSGPKIKIEEAISTLRTANNYVSNNPTLIVKNVQKVFELSLSYWTTPLTVGLLPKKRDLSTDTPIIIEKKGYLLTDPIGGKQEPGLAQKLKRLRYGLLSRDRICTQEDIISFIRSQFQEFQINHIELKQTVIKAEESGLTRCWQIKLDVSDTIIQNPKFKYLIDETELLLNNKSTGVIPIRLQYL